MSQAFVYLAYLPAVTFWGLDGYFLWQERLFRGLYDKVRVGSEAAVDFSMKTTRTEKWFESWAGAALSATLIAFHGAVVVSILVAMLLPCWMR